MDIDEKKNMFSWLRLAGVINSLYSVPFWVCHDFLGHNIQPPIVSPKSEYSLPSPPTYIFLPGFKASSSMHHLSTTARPAILRELSKDGMV